MVMLLAGMGSCREDPLTSMSSTPPLAKPTISKRTDNASAPIGPSSSIDTSAPRDQHPESNASQISLDNLFNRSKRIVVRKSEVNDKILYESNKKPDLALLHEVMRIVPKDGKAIPCRHIAGPIIEFYFKKRYIGWVAIHDNVAIRTSFWNTDAEIADKERFIKWFDRRGIAGPRRRAEAEGWRSSKNKKN